MPIYEYTCQKCQKKFEHLHRSMSETEKVKCPMTVRRRAGSNNQTSIGGAGEGRNRVLNLGGVAQVDLVYLHPERWCHGLNDAELGNTGRYAGISKYRRSCQAWHNLFE